MARTTTPASSSAPHAARSAVDIAPAPASRHPRPPAPAAGGSPAAAVLAAMSGGPAGASVTRVAARVTS
jgi:hypothetical protein